jgi:hypothetical protein
MTTGSLPGSSYLVNWILTMLVSIHRRFSMVIAKGVMLDITFPYTHLNGLVEITTMVVQTLAMRTNLFISAWGDAISHTTMLIPL